MSAAALECVDVGQTYRAGTRAVPALRSVSKSFPAGRVTTVAGPSGSGKSTLMRILACVDRPAGGRVVVEGRDVASLREPRRRRLRRYRLAYLFQNPADNLIEYLPAGAQIRLAADLRGAQADDARVEELLALLGLEHRRTHRPQEMSGGEQQRLAIACAVAGRPAVVLADEPTAELDTASSHRVLEAFRSLRDAGTAFVLTSHDAIVIGATDHLLRLEHGETVESW